MTGRLENRLALATQRVNRFPLSLLSTACQTSTHAPTVVRGGDDNSAITETCLGIALPKVAS